MIGGHALFLGAAAFGGALTLITEGLSLGHRLRPGWLLASWIVAGGIALAVGVALVACVAFGAVVGAGLHILIKRLGFDPAVSSGPFIASIVDVLGIVIYVQTAIWIMGLSPAGAPTTQP